MRLLNALARGGTPSTHRPAGAPQRPSVKAITYFHGFFGVASAAFRRSDFRSRQEARWNGLVEMSLPLLKRRMAGGQSAGPTPPELCNLLKAASNHCWPRSAGVRGYAQTGHFLPYLHNPRTQGRNESWPTQDHLQFASDARCNAELLRYSLSQSRTDHQVWRDAHIQCGKICLVAPARSMARPRSATVIHTMSDEPSTTPLAGLRNYHSILSRSAWFPRCAATSGSRDATHFVQSDIACQGQTGNGATQPRAGTVPPSALWVGSSRSP